MDLFGFPLSLTEVILYSALLLVFLMQVFFYLFFFGRIFFRKEIANQAETEPVSVIICARNEEENLKANLPAIVSQKYPEYEVIVVNDCSEDESIEVLKSFAANHPHFRYTTIKKDEKFSHGKKLAVMVGLKSAKYQTVLFTDADCMPLSDQWLAGMTAQVTKSREICLGYSGFNRRKGWWNLFFRFDAFFIAMHYFSFAMARIPYMGVGRNLAYRKHLFFDNKGFARHLDLDSGDDDLFINEVATKNNTAICYHPDLQTRSEAPVTLARWLRQKVRHRSTFSRYRMIHRFWLTAEPISRLFYYALLVAIAFLSSYPLVPAGVFAFRLILQLTVFYQWTRKLNEKDLWLFAPVSDILSIFTGLILVYKSLFGVKNSAWK